MFDTSQSKRYKQNLLKFSVPLLCSWKRSDSPKIWVSFVCTVPIVKCRTHFKIWIISFTLLWEILEVNENFSNVLENCRNHTRYELNHYVNLNKLNNKNSFSSYFLNIDGNKANFDNFVAELQLLDAEFSVIGLAETNTYPTNKDCFMINNYTSCYQDTIPNKQKGTGVAL